jgi:hypothetical protein
MKFNPFQLAAEKAKQAVGEKAWRSLGFAEQSAAIYRQLQLIDADLVASQAFRQEAFAGTHTADKPLPLRRADQMPKARRDVDSEAA